MEERGEGRGRREGRREEREEELWRKQKSCYHHLHRSPKADHQDSKAGESVVFIHVPMYPCCLHVYTHT